MSTDSHSAAHGADGLPRNADVAYEERDFRAATIYWYLFALGVCVVVSLFICVYIQKYLQSVAESSDTPQTPAMVNMQRTMTPQQIEAMSYPPEPRLQGVPGHESDPQSDLRRKNAADMKENETLQWIDKNAGIAQIPVSDAMKIIAEKGLPGATPAGGNPGGNSGGKK
jgi:hypothetical protein